MTSSTGDLTRAFIGVGSAHESDDLALEEALRRVVTEGRGAWPSVVVTEVHFATWLGRLAPADQSPTDWLTSIRAGDLYLACACAASQPEALRAFDAAFLTRLDDYLHALRPTAELVAETRQALLERLFVGPPGKPPKIASYSGRGALGGWVRVTAVRTALNLLERDKAGPETPDETGIIASALAPDDSPDLEVFRSRYQGAFATALREAIAALSRRDRGLLRFTFIERMTPAQIGAIYGVHRTTAMRWIDSTQAEVLSGTRSRLMKQLRLSASDCDGVLALVKSRFDQTLGSLLRTPA